MAQGRRKEPDKLRQSLLDHAIDLAVGQGLAAVTTQGVAEAAGVSKGGLFHHFASKQALIEGVVAHLIDRMDGLIEQVIDPNPLTPGRFTRAYVEALLDPSEPGLGAQWPALAMSLLSEPAMQRLWQDWIEGRLATHSATDAGPDLAILRLAADGLWLAEVTGTGQGAAPSEVIRRLLERVAEAAPLDQARRGV